MQLILKSSREHKEKANDVDDAYTCGNLHRARNQRLPTGRVLILDLVRAARSPPCGLYLCREMLTKKEEPKLPFLFYARRTPTNGSSRSGAGRSRRAACGRTFVMPPFWPELAAGAVASEPSVLGSGPTRYRSKPTELLRPIGLNGRMEPESARQPLLPGHVLGRPSCLVAEPIG
jgi:hypothetical protein